VDHHDFLIARTGADALLDGRVLIDASSSSRSVSSNRESIYIPGGALQHTVVEGKLFVDKKATFHTLFLCKKRLMPFSPHPSKITAHFAKTTANDIFRISKKHRGGVLTPNTPAGFATAMIISALSIGR